MQVRLGFAVAAFLEPEILVVDEVLAVGDAEFQKKAIAKMQDVSSGDGRTVLFVSHNMGSVRKLCHNGVVLKNGMVDFIGSVNDAVDHYLIDYTDSLSRSVVINSDKHRKKKNLGLELEVIEVTLDDKPTELSSDEPIGMTIKLKRNSKKIKSASLNIILHDAISDIRLFNFHAPSVDLPEDTEYFSVHVLLKNHNLKKRLITFDVEACGRNDVNSYIFADQVSRVLSFEMKYKSKQKNVLWTESWGLVDFDGDNYIDVEILK